MAEELDRRTRERAEVSRFVNGLFESTGLEHWADFARAADVLPSSLSDWKDARNAASGRNLVKLIVAAERFNEEARSAAARSVMPRTTLWRRLLHPLAVREELEEYLDAEDQELDAAVKDLTRIRREQLSSLLADRRRAKQQFSTIEGKLGQLATKDDLQRAVDTLRAAIDALANPGTQQATSSK